MTKPLAIVLASGGMDSCVAIAIASLDFDLALLHVNYGQRTQERELQAFHDIAEFYQVPESRRMVISIEHLSRIGGSSLTDAHLAVKNAGTQNAGIPDTYVPFRNANMLSIAVSWAEVAGAQAIFIGAVEEDSSGYPDCRRTFYEAYQKVIQTGTKNEMPIIIRTPLIDLSKADIVRKGVALGAPLHLTWSCYKDEVEACGMCESCALRLRGFSQAEMSDPIPYRKRRSDAVSNQSDDLQAR